MPIGTIENFDVSKPCDWGTYSKRFDLFCVANKITDLDLKRATFLTVCGAETFELLESLIAPNKVSDLVIKDILTTLSNHFSPRPSEIAASYTFFKRDQRPGECVAEYVAELRRLAKSCNFPKDSLDRMLRDRLVCGLRNTHLQQMFLAETDLQLRTVIDRSVATEAAEKNQQAIAESHQVKQIFRKHQPAPSKFNFPKKPLQSQRCFSCGEDHIRSSCRFRTATCSFCGIMGHIQRVCHAMANSRNKPKDNKKRSNRRNREVKIVSNPSSVNTSATVIINHVPCVLEVDSGSRHTIISEKTFQAIFRKPPPLREANLKLVDFQRNPIDILGCLDVDVLYNGAPIPSLPLYVTTGNKTSVLGCEWFEPLGISIQGVHSIKNTSFSDVLVKYSHLFSPELGSYSGPPVVLQVDPKVMPIRLPARKIPIAMRAAVEDELDKLVQQGILEPVEYSEWATPIVPVPKSDGSVRICGDYKSTVNKALTPHCFPVPSANQLLSTIPNGSVFAKLDLAQAYQQLKVDDASSLVQTITTHKGAFKVNRLQFGISTAPGIFQNFMENLLRGFPGVIPYFDDIIVIASSDTDLRQKLIDIFQRVDQAGIRLKEDKCQIGCSSVDFLGYRIDSEGLHPTQQKIDTIRSTPPPTEKGQLQAFLGLINFYHSFIQDKATLAEPLHQLLHKSVPWRWGPDEQRSFDALKGALMSSNVLMPFSETYPLLLVCDASPYGIGVILSHRVGFRERPIAYHSRTMTKTERRYSQGDREALAVIVGVKKFHDFLYGREFVIVTDHKPLLGRFTTDVPTPEILSPRMIRWSTFLSAYNFKLVYRAGKDVGNADGLSRLPVPRTTIVAEEEEVLLIDMVHKPTVHSEDIAIKTGKDPVLSQILQWTLRGWPESKPADEFQPFWSRRTEISTLKGCLLWGYRVIIPHCHRSQILSALHTAHPGIVRMKSLARGYVWWPKLDADIEKVVRQCTKCQSNRPEAAQSPVHPWKETTKPWSRIHIDFAGPHCGKTYFILIDSYSKWLEVAQVATTSAACAIQVLRRLFATHGIPEVIVSDNGTAFESAEFRQFCETNGIRPIYVAPWHPRSNGQAEIMVKSTKDFLKKESSGDIQQRLAKFLHHHHATPSTATDKTPAELLFNRRIRTFFDHLHPDNIRVHKTKPVVDQPRKLSDGSTVWARNYSSGPKWIPAVVTRTTGPVSYTVETDQGQPMRRHIDQLRRRETDNDSLNISLTDTQSVTSHDVTNAENVQTTPSSIVPSTIVDAPSPPDIQPSTSGTQQTADPISAMPQTPSQKRLKKTPSVNEDVPLRRSARSKTTTPSTDGF